MATAPRRDRLQPALLDRLADGLGDLLARRSELRARLAPLLDAGQRAALEEGLDADRLPPTLSRRPGTPFAGLAEPAGSLFDDLMAVEHARRAALDRQGGVTREELHAGVLRNLRDLFATTQAWEADGDGADDALAGLPRVASSVLNYGVPGIAGRVHAPADVERLARALEQAIRRFEPRIRHPRVRAEGPGADGLDAPVAFVLEGELWGHPLPEALRVRTLLDLVAARLELDVPESAGAG